jgi:hypothetical protein
MRFSLSCAIVVAAFSLAACDRNGGTAASTPEAVVAAANAKAVSLMPPFAPLFPGARVQSSIGTGTGPTAAGTVSFSTNAAVDDVIAFYRGKATAAGMEETPDFGEAGTTVFSALREKDQMGIRVIAAGASGGTDVQIVWARQSDEDDQ